MPGLVLTLSLALQTAGAPPPVEASNSPSDIVVIAQRNADALARCLRDGRSPMDDIKASIAVAEQTFVDGDYRGARSILARSIARNKRHASALPTAVAALYEASANVNLHYGDQRSYRQDVANQVRIIRDAAPAGGAQRVVAATLLGDMWLALGDSHQAEMSYRSAASHAVELGQPKLAAYVDLRRVSLHLAAGDTSKAADILREVDAGSFATDAGVKATASAMRVRLASARKDDAALERALAELAALSPGGAPVLLKADPIHVSAAMDAERSQREWNTPVGSIPLGSASLRWIDVGFLIGPEGRVRDVEVLRGGMSVERTGAVLRHIRSRRYAQFTPEDGAIGSYRVERYTLRSPMGMELGSLIRRRTGAPQLEMIDITRSHAPPPAES